MKIQDNDYVFEFQDSIPDCPGWLYWLGGFCFEATAVILAFAFLYACYKVLL